MEVILKIFFIGVSLMVVSLLFSIKPQRSVRTNSLSLASKDDIKQKAITRNIEKKVNETKKGNPEKIHNNTKKHNKEIVSSIKKRTEIVKPEIQVSSIDKKNKIKKSINKNDVNFIELEKNALSEHQDKIIKLLKNEEVKEKNRTKLQETINEIDAFRNHSNYEDSDSLDDVQDQDYNKMFENIINPNVYSIKNKDNSLLLEYSKEEMDIIGKELENSEIKELKTLKRKVELF